MSSPIGFAGPLRMVRTPILMVFCASGGPAAPGGRGDARGVDLVGARLAQLDPQREAHLALRHALVPGLVEQLDEPAPRRAELGVRLRDARLYPGVVAPREIRV